MVKLKAWILASRLRTLPLSLSGIITGTALANDKGFSDTLIFVLALLTTVAFQITSNLSNDYGDGTKGTDNENRIGPSRALQAGLLTELELKRGILVAVIISLLLALMLLVAAFGLFSWYFLVFLVLTLLSIWAAIKYTVGDSAYGYRGLGDLFVFLFFGLVAVMGSEFLYTKSFAVESVLPALSIGLLSVGVLNLNNLRDIESDRDSGKRTLAVKWGFKNGKRYHACILILAFASMLGFTVWTNKSVFEIVYLLAFVPVFIHLRKALGTEEPKSLDPELKKLALSTFALSVILYIAMNYFF